MVLMATLTNYSIVRMGAQTPVLQPHSAAPALCDTQQVIVLLHLPPAGQKHLRGTVVCL